MKITEVEAIVLRQPTVDAAIADGTQDDLIVRIYTDEGITGVGEVDSSPEVARAAITAPASHVLATGLRDILLGENPLDVDALWQKMYERSIFYGRRGVVIHAMSGIDLALWDIKGKAAGKPVCDLLDRPQRSRLRAYASVLMPDTEAEVSELVRAMVEQHGFTAVKLGWGPMTRNPEHHGRLARAAKQAAGSSVDILIDAGFGYGADAARAIPVVREMEELGIFWVEEPFEPDEFEAYATLADAVGIRVAAGEENATRWEFQQLMEQGHVDVIQPDVTRCGGLTEGFRIAQMAQQRGVAVVPHVWKSGIVKAASLHLNAVLSEALFLEYSVADTPIGRELTSQTFPVRDGYVEVPRTPGLGIDLNQDILERFAVGPAPRPVGG